VQCKKPQNCHLSEVNAGSAAGDNEPTNEQKNETNLCDHSAQAAFAIEPVVHQSFA